MNFIKGKGKFFSNTSKDYEAILKTIGYQNLKHIKLTEHPEVVEEYEKLLRYYQPRMDITDQCIEKLVSGLKTRIGMLEKNIIMRRT